MITDSGKQVMALMLPAAGTPGDQVTGLGLGADDDPPKPFHFPGLVLRIRALAWIDVLRQPIRDPAPRLPEHWWTRWLIPRRAWQLTGRSGRARIVAGCLPPSSPS